MTAAGAAAVLGGVLVLRSRGAAGVAAGPSDLPSAGTGWVDAVRVWDAPREVGAALVVLGLLALVGAAGGRQGASGRSFPAPRVLLLCAVVAGVLVAGGATVLARPSPSEVVYEGTYQLLDHAWEPPPPSVVTATAVWSRGEVGAALVAVVGLLLGSAAAGVAVGRRGPDRT